MSKTFTPCPDNFGKLTPNFSVNTSGHTSCPPVVCNSTQTNTSHIKNYKDAYPDNSGFSFINNITVNCQQTTVNRQLSTQNHLTHMFTPSTLKSETLKTSI